MKLIALFAIVLLSFNGFTQLSDKWEGDYIGDLYAQNISGAENSYRMELHIEKLSETSFSWIIVYGEDSLRQERKYQLNLLKGNAYQLDEKKWNHP